jgi:hypothetical protein
MGVTAASHSIFFSEIFIAKKKKLTVRMESMGVTACISAHKSSHFLYHVFKLKYSTNTHIKKE